MPLCRDPFPKRARLTAPLYRTHEGPILTHVAHVPSHFVVAINFEHLNVWTISNFSISQTTELNCGF